MKASFESISARAAGDLLPRGAFPASTTSLSRVFSLPQYGDGHFAIFEWSKPRNVTTTDSRLCDFTHFCTDPHTHKNTPNTHIRTHPKTLKSNRRKRVYQKRWSAAPPSPTYCPSPTNDLGRSTDSRWSTVAAGSKAPCILTERSPGVCPSSGDNYSSERLSSESRTPRSVDSHVVNLHG
eukprot:1175735-Prorocentrum_minimum.AAC.7